MAGESAREYARRQREKAERHARVAAAYERGAEGEATTAIVLDELAARGWVVLHDIRWPGRPRANIDHVAIGPGGVFVIDSKNWNGSITVDGGALRVNGRRRDKAATGTSEAAAAISTLLGGMPVNPVLCFVRDDPIAGRCGGVALSSTSNIATFLTSCPPSLHPQAIGRVHQQLVAGLAVEARRASLSDHDRRATRPGPHTNTRRAPGRAGRTRSKRGSLARRLIVLVAAAVFMLAVGPAAIGGLMGLATKAVQEIIVPTNAVGDTVEVAASGRRPTLDVALMRVDETPPAVEGVRLAQGQRLVALYLRFKNTGATPWTSPGPRVVLADGGPTPYPALSEARKFAAGPLLGKLGRLSPGASRDGHVIIAVPLEAVLIEVRVTVGPGLPETVTFKLAQ